jgi:uncharacterized protein YciI
MKLFVVVLRYIQESDMVDQIRPTHLDYVNECYKKGLFLLSGPMQPRIGGIILAQAENREVLWKVLQKDPFYKQNIAEFSVHEFLPSRHHTDLIFFNRYF